MNIKNRLKKMEDEMQTGKSDSAFCECAGKQIIKIQTKAQTTESPPEICQVCGKEIRRRLVTFKFSGDIEVIKPKADYHRAEF